MSTPQTSAEPFTQGCGDEHVQPDGLAYTPQQIEACTQRCGLLSLTLALPTAPSASANLAPDGDGAAPMPVPAGGWLVDLRAHVDRPMDRQQVAMLFQQAASAGCLRVRLEDQPGLDDASRLAWIDLARSAGLAVDWHMADGQVDATMAQALAQRGVGVMLRLEALQATLHDRLVGQDGSHARAMASLAALQSAGVASIAVSLGACQASEAGLPALWRWLRERGALPRLRIATPHDAQAVRHGALSPQAYQALLATLRQLDEAVFGVAWPASQVTGRCSWQPMVGLHVDGATGRVRPTRGIDITLSSLHRESLREVLEQSEVLENLRMSADKLKHPCRACLTERGCLCSRTAAWQATGDDLSADPFCPHAQGVTGQALPLPAASWVPHGPSMRTIDTLVMVGERRARTRWTVSPDSPLVGPDGRLDPTAYIEMVAQSFAASHGFHMTDEERARHRGLLLGVKDMTLSGSARAGDTLETEIIKISRFGNFGVIEGGVRHVDGQPIAHLEVKIWRPGPQDDVILPA